MKFLNLIVIGTLLACAPLGRAQSSVDACKLLSAVQVDSTGIYLDQVTAPADPAKAIPHLRLARAPQPGTTSLFSRTDIAALAQGASAGLLLTNWAGADSVKVTRRMRLLEDSEVIELLTTTLQKEYIKNEGELELQLTHPWTPAHVPDEPLTVRFTQMPSRGVSPTFLATIELWTGKERVGSWQVSLHASVWRDVPVARSLIPRGELVRTADIAMERSDVLLQRDSYINFAKVNDTLEIAENVPAGHPILSRMVRERPLILRGQLVEAIFRDGTLDISLTVETLEDGALGQTVRVRNPKTKRELYGKVESERSIRITL